MARPRPAAALILAVAAGVAGWAAHPPVGQGWLAFTVVPLLLAAVTIVTPPAGRPRRSSRPAVIGAVAGLVTFLAMLAWLIPPAGYLGWLLLAATQAAWYAGVTGLLARWVHSGWLVAAAPVLWTGMEVWRARVPLHGFGWGALGYAHANGSWLLPAARVVGASGLSFLTVLMGTLVFVAALRARQTPGGFVRARTVAPALLGLAAVTVTTWIGIPPAPAATGERVDVLAVQGNDFQPSRVTSFDADLTIADSMLELTRASVGASGPPDLTVWPENSIDLDPYTPTGSFLFPFVREAAAATRGQLLFGTNLDGPRPAETFLNSANLVGPDGQVLDRYVKRRYVPFGEYVPWRRLLGDLPPLRQIPRDGVPGPGADAVDAAATDVAVVICYETLFPEIVRSNVLAGGAGLVVAITNDASFGRSAESAQHLAQSQLRAVESGRFLVHAALSGESALIDSDGRVRIRTRLFERATIREDVPTVTAATPFLATGDLVGGATRWAALAVAVGQLLLSRRGRRAAFPTEETA